jgi:hypothetical protein
MGVFLQSTGSFSPGCPLFQGPTEWNRSTRDGHFHVIHRQSDCATFLHTGGLSYLATSTRCTEPATFLGLSLYLPLHEEPKKGRQTPRGCWKCVL